MIVTCPISGFILVEIRTDCVILRNESPANRRTDTKGKDVSLLMLCRCTLCPGCSSIATLLTAPTSTTPSYPKYIAIVLLLCYRPPHPPLPIHATPSTLPLSYCSVIDLPPPHATTSTLPLSYCSVIDLPPTPPQVHCHCPTALL